VLEPLVSKGLDRCVYETGAADLPVRFRSPRTTKVSEMKHTITLKDGRVARTNADPNKTIVHLNFASDRVQVIHKRVVDILSTKTVTRPLAIKTLSAALQASQLGDVVIHFGNDSLAENSTADLTVIAEVYAELHRAHGLSDEQTLVVAP
jgi:hypothetical protein